MSEELKPVEMLGAHDLRDIVEEVRTTGEPRLLREAGEDVAIIMPVSKDHAKARKTEPDYAAFRSAAGSWSDVDTDGLIADIYADRERSDRPPVDL
ncbi:MAG: hypothetical protein ACR2JC_13300 [Chloroflexota bacterium]|nr:MAG: hypothetical protein DLM70_15000 [Chloroflexota bacterium]